MAQNEPDKNRWGICQVDNYYTDMYKTLWASQLELQTALYEDAELRDWLKPSSRYFVVHIENQIQLAVPARYTIAPMPLPAPVAPVPRAPDDEVPF